MNERSEAIRIGGQVRRARHAARLGDGRPAPPVDATPELAQAWHQLQLHWLGRVPGYREQVQTKLRDAIAAEIARYGACSGCGGDLAPDRYTQGCKQCGDRRAGRARRARDVDKLGREIEGCG